MEKGNSRCVLTMQASLACLFAWQHAVTLVGTTWREVALVFCFLGVFNYIMTRCFKSFYIYIPKNLLFFKSGIIFFIVGDVVCCGAFVLTSFRRSIFT